MTAQSSVLRLLGIDVCAFRAIVFDLEICKAVTGTQSRIIKITTPVGNIVESKIRQVYTG